MAITSLKQAFAIMKNYRHQYVCQTIGDSEMVRIQETGNPNVAWIVHRSSFVDWVRTMWHQKRLVKES
jgi:flavin-dependent dehydrogenase